MTTGLDIVASKLAGGEAIRSPIVEDEEIDPDQLAACGPRIQLFGSICQSGNSNCPDACTLVLSSSHRVASDTSFPENQAGG